MNIVWLRDLNKNSIKIAGGKGAQLGEMYNSNFPVPPAFVVSAQAYKEFLSMNHLDVKIKSVLKDLNVDSTRQLMQASEIIKEIILNEEMSPSLKNDIIEAYNILNVNEDVLKAGKNVLELIKNGRDSAFVAVRSSATAEDLPSIDGNSCVLIKIDSKPVYDTISNIYDKIGDGTNNLIEVASMQDNEVKWIKAQQIYKHPANESKLYKITTESGRTINITKNHSLIVLDPNTLKPKVTSISELNGDEMVPVTRNVPLINSDVEYIDLLDYIHGEDVHIENDLIYIKNKSSNWKIQNPLPRKIKLDKAFAYFLGVYCAEGNTYKNNNIGITSTDFNIMNNIKEFLEKLNLYNEQKLNKGTLRIYCKTLVRFLHKTIGTPLDTKGKGRSCKIKKVPDFIFGCNKEMIGSFLAGCFDGDGYINSNVIEYCSTSEKLIGGVIKLLEMLDIDFYIRRKNNAINIILPGSEAIKFKELINLKNENKIKKLDELIKLYNNKKNHPKFLNNIKISEELSNIIKLKFDNLLEKQPVEVSICPICKNNVNKTGCYKNKLRYYCKNCNKSFYKVNKKFVDKYINYDSKGRFIKNSIPWNKGNLSGCFSRKKFIEVMEENGLNEYANLFKKSVMWDRIKNIKEYDYNGYVYDFTVPNIENFVAGIGGIITHNTASFAGMQETFLNIRGEKNLIIAIKKCWASLFTPRAIFYRIKNNFPHEKVLIAVIIQKMISSEKSGVLFTVNPGTNNKNEIVIEAGFGLGEAIVSGAVNPDLYVLDKDNLKLKKKEIKKQKFKIIRDENTGETVHKKIPESEQGQQVLSESEIYKLGELGKNIDEHYGKPQDIEFAVEKSRIYIVQSRPVTTLGEEIKGEELKGEILTEGLSASPGVKTGIVKIIRNENEIDEFPEQGYVLVTTMTNPSMVPIMKKAVAIVTDEGGTTCFAGDTKVLTNKGFICMEEAVRRVKEGEEFLIFSYDYENKKPKWKRVLNSGRRKSEVIRVSVSQKGVMHHNYIDLTPDHKMFTFNNRDLIKKEIKNVLSDKEMLCLVDRLPEFENNSNEKLAYLTGALLSDGYIGLTKHHTGNFRRGRVIFTQKNTEEKKEFIEAVKNNFKEIFNEEFNIIKEKYSCNNLRGRLIQGTALDHICFKMGPALALNNISQNLGSWCLGLSDNSCLNFLAGLIDGDGSFYENRLHIYVSKENVLQGVVVACLKLGIIPQVTVNRNIHNVQILERIEDILNRCKRVNGYIRKRITGTKFFAARQILSDIINNTNYKGRIKPYVDNNLLLDERKIREKIIPMLEGEIKNEILDILNSNVRMHRVCKEDELGETYVYNLEVEADNEMNHNYIIFTKKYTPLLVSNSHAAIVSRELGIPCIVGTENATSVLEDGLIITVDAVNGKVYKGEVKKEEQKSIEVLDKGEGIETKTKIYMNLGEPEKISDYKDLNFDGIGLMRLEFIIAGEVGEHPNYLIKTNQEEKYINELVNGIEKVARAINGKPIIVRFSDFKTNEYKDLKGGKEFEEHEDNPMIGFRGVSRYISNEFKESFKLECRAIKKVRETYRNVHVMLPFVRTVEEVEKCLEIMKEEKLVRSDEFKIWLMAEVPSMALISEDFAKLAIDGVSIGSNDLTMLCLGVDRDNEKLGKMGYFDERNKAVLVAIKNIIEGFKKHGKTTSLCGQSVSNYPEIAEFLVRNGITSVSVNPDVVGKVRREVSEIEEGLKGSIIPNFFTF